MTVATRVPATFKIEARTKKRVDLLSTALNVDKSALIDEAIELLSKQHKPKVDSYLREASGGFDTLSPEERLLGRRRRPRPERTAGRR